ncbi:signal peptidase II [Sulfitobacter aestuariivivens]|uniref:Lipoprotein signal peptidase n=1 Tax=Sulfitobacter aestuariivivens TaxID=2766981 RepID=A0A927D5V1_9RHOB|nr:signal peptidase II [Sulfitobacter aestuariivivens]MBD3664783.1 signal peptidase II [Sulfitobacter aestuariivivens]
MRAFGLSALVAFLIDQISKYVVIHMWGLRAGNPMDVLPPWLNFIYGENCGINFGLFGECSEASRWILIGLAVVICGAVTIWLYRSQQGWLAHVSAGLLVGGALANVLDRLAYGYVLDFLNNSLPGWNNPFVYNIADIFVFAGAIGLIFFAKDQKPAPKKRQ